MMSVVRTISFACAIAVLPSGAFAADATETPEAPAEKVAPEDSEAAKAIAWLFRTPPDQTRIELRLTSVDSAGRSKVAELTLRHTRNEDGTRLEVSLADKKQPLSEFCLRCDEKGALVPCTPMADAIPATGDELIPGTLFPWNALTFGLCRPFKVRSSELSTDGKFDIVVYAQEKDADEVAMEKAKVEADDKTKKAVVEGAIPALAGSLRVFVSHGRQFPEKIEQFDAAGVLSVSIDIHEFRRTAWGRAVTNSTWNDMKKRTRVLIEVRGGDVGPLPPKKDSETP